jgi:2-keto-3-deoxy-galactonokinase
MHTSHFWQSAGLIAIIFGAAILSAMIGSRAHAAAAPHVSTPSAAQTF